jgi:hypothetical protein
MKNTLERLARVGKDKYFLVDGKAPIAEFLFQNALKYFAIEPLKKGSAIKTQPTERLAIPCLVRTNLGSSFSIVNDFFGKKFKIKSI